MGSGQFLIVFRVLDDVELERLESIDGCSVAAGGEGEELATTVILPLVEQDLPQPVHMGAVGCVPVYVVAMVT